MVLGVEDVDGEGAAGDGEAGDVAEEVGKLLRVHRGGGDDELQVGPAGDHGPEGRNSFPLLCPIGT